MCKQCSDAIKTELKKRHWRPKDKEVTDFLWICTAFPCADGETTAKQIHQMFRRFGRRKTWASFFDAAMTYSEAETAKAMSDRRRRKTRQREQAP